MHPSFHAPRKDCRGGVFSILLKNHNGLIAGDIEALPAGWVWAEHLVVHPNQVVGRFGELRTIQVLGT